MTAASKRQDERTGEIHSRLDKQAEKSSERGQVNWGVAVAICSLVWLVVIAVVTWGMTQATDVAVSKAHAAVMDERIEKLDTVLQREMRLLTETRKAEICALDTQLQREMRMLNDASTERHKRQDDKLIDHAAEIEKLHRVTDKILELRTVEAEKRGYQAAQIDSLNKHTEILEAFIHAPRPDAEK